MERASRLYSKSSLSLYLIMEQRGVWMIHASRSHAPTLLPHSCSCDVKLSQSPLIYMLWQLQLMLQQLQLMLKQLQLRLLQSFSLCVVLSLIYKLLSLRILIFALIYKLWQLQLMLQVVAADVAAVAADDAAVAAEVAAKLLPLSLCLSVSQSVCLSVCRYLSLSPYIYNFCSLSFSPSLPLYPSSLPSSPSSPTSLPPPSL